MPLVRRLSSSTTVLFSLIAAGALLAIAAGTLHESQGRQADSGQWVARSQRMLHAISACREGLARISRGQIAYLLSGSPAFLAQRNEAIEQTEQAVRELEQLSADDPTQRALAARLAAAVQERLEIAHQMQEMRVRTGRPPQVVLEGGTPGHLPSREALALATEMEEAEFNRVARYQHQELRERQAASQVIAACFAAFAALILLSYGALYAEARRRRRSELQLEEIVDELPLTVWQVDLRRQQPLRFVFVAKNSARHRGVERTEVMADAAATERNVLDEDRPRLQAAVRQASETAGAFDCMYRIRSATGQAHWIHSRATPRRQSDGSVRMTGYWADVTAQKQLEDALRRATDVAEAASAAKTQFFATVAHEIRTPLHGLLGLLELLALSSLEPEQRATLAVARESGHALVRIIDDVLDLSKVEANRLALHPVPASLRELVVRACELHAAAASSRGLSLDVALDPQLPPWLRFDPLRLTQILHNLVSNALKFTRAGGVRVVAECVGPRGAAGQCVRLSVIDTGIGVAPEVVERLFEPFVQAHTGIAASHGGTGLGLAICRRLAALMGGTVQMHSALGQGTTLVVDLCLPVVDGADSAQQEASAAAARHVAARRIAPDVQEAEREGTLVLVVDDHPINRSLLLQQLALLGYAAMSAPDGREALQLRRSHRFALVLADCNMPVLDGYGLARAIRADEALTGAARVPVLACTASILPDEDQRCAQAGMDDRILKPVDLATLAHHLDRWLPLPQCAPGAAVHDAFGRVASARSRLFDPAALALVAGKDPAAQQRIAQEFLRAHAHDLARMKRAAADGDMAGLRQLTHRAMGAAMALGALELVEACRALEQSAHTGDAELVEVDLHELGARSEELGDALHRAFHVAPR